MDAPSPLSPLQEHLLEQHARSPGTPWSTTLAVAVHGALDRRSLQAALDLAVRRHEILRTRFARADSLAPPVSVVGEPRPASLAFHDLGSLSWEEQRERVAALERSLAASVAAGDGPALAAALAVPAVPLRDGQLLILAQSSRAADWRSLWNLTSELAHCLAGEPLAEDPLQFADIARWSRDALQDEDAPTGFEFWRRIDLERVALSLPLELAPELDGGEPSFRPVELADRLPADVARMLGRHAREQGLPVEALLLAAWQALLARLSERSELVVGLCSPGRAFPGLDEALGPLARFLPAPARLDERSSLAELARRADEHAALAQEWHEYFEPRQLSATELLFSHAFEFLPRVEPLEKGGLRFECARRHSLAEPFRCALIAEELPDGFELRFAHDPRFLSAGAAAVLAEEYRTLLQDACARPATPARSLALVSPAMEERLERFSRGPELTEEPGCIHDRIVSAARQRPEAPAVSAGGQRLSYRELDELSARLAARLQELGAGPGKFVGLHLENSVELVVALLAVLRAGGAYLPLPPGYPRERLRFMLEDARARIVLTRSPAPAPFEGFSGEQLALDARSLAALPAREPETRSRPDDPAYAIYTSGSTGEPKGVPITHANLAHSTRARLAHYGGRVERYLLLSSFGFDSSVAGIFWTLVQGGELVLAPEGFERELHSLPALIARSRATHLLALPALWSLVLEQTSDGELGGELEALDTVIVAGESCPPELVRRHQERLPRVRLHNEYGPTEGTVWSTVFDCSRPCAGRVPIGRPIPGARVFVLDEHGEPAPVGVAGELWIAGPGVAHGYLHRPELTAARFVSDLRGAGRGYRTGDRARWLPDGDLEFLGRSDQQVKIRGFRIELAEIEEELRAHAGVRDAAGVAREQEGGGTRLVGYVLANGETVEESALQRHLSARLPEYMVPARILALAAWPLLPNGKLDRAALPLPEDSPRSAEPVGALETVLAALWADVLGLEQVGRDDDFFALGGHSLLATRLYARLRETLQVTLPLRLLFERRTPAALAAELGRDDPGERERLVRVAEVVLAVLSLPDEGEHALGA